MAEAGTLHDAFIDELRDTYDAEKQLTKALAKLAKASSNPKLRQAFDLSQRLLEMRFERGPEFCIRRGFRQLWQGLRQLLFGVVRVAQFINESVMERSCFSHGRISSIGGWLPRAHPSHDGGLISLECADVSACGDESIQRAESRAGTSRALLCAVSMLSG